MRRDYDVVVVGGGAAGICAAVQAGRAGASTLLVEKNGVLGGTMTAGGVAAPGLFHAWGRQVVAGVGWELVAAAVAEVGGKLPDFAAPARSSSRHQVSVNPAVFAALADGAVVAAGAELLLHAMLAEAGLRKGRWNLSVCTKTGLQETSCRVLVDCTGDANAAAIAGLAVDRHEPMQPGTLIFELGGYELDELDLPTIERAFADEIAGGRFGLRELGWGDRSIAKVLRWRGRNALHVCEIDGTSSESRTRAELAGRELMLRLYRFLRRQPGLEGVRIQWMAPECGIRETVTIHGRSTITFEDYFGGRRWDDALCYSFYPIDVHLADGTGLDKRMLPAGVVPTIPRGAMLPADGQFFVAAGRHICGDREAYSAYRTQASCMATGQAAGAMAALAAASDLEPGQLDLEEIRAVLREHGAIVP